MVSATVQIKQALVAQLGRQKPRDKLRDKPRDKPRDNCATNLVTTARQPRDVVGGLSRLVLGDSALFGGTD